MLKRYIQIFIVIVALCIPFAYSEEPDYSDKNNFGFEYWAGREGFVKKSLELPVTSFMGYGIEYTPIPSPPIYLYLDLPLSKNDTDKHGKIYIRIFSSIEDAQKYLLDSLYSITSPDKLPHLTSEEFSPGDVAFGKESSSIDKVYYDTRYDLFFCRSNVFIRVKAPPDVAKELAVKIDNIIQGSQDWSVDDASPHLIISDEFVQAFRQALRR